MITNKQPIKVNAKRGMNRCMVLCREGRGRKEGRQKKLANNEFLWQTQIDKLNATYDNVKSLVW